MTEDAFYTQSGSIYTPQPIARGPWNQNSLHGRVVIALLAHEIEQKHMSPEWHPARLTVDMYRLPGFAPTEVKTWVVREGGRIKVVDAEFFSGGVSHARATCQLLRRAENPEGERWSPPNWNAPHPDAIDVPQGRNTGLGGMWMMKSVDGAGGMIGPPGERQTWMREIRPLVAGKPLTPFTRVAPASDFASPLANRSDKGLGFINTDVTIYMHRLPVGEWIGLANTNHHATDGIAIGECFLYDVEGPFGSAAVAALAQKRMAGPPPQQVVAKTTGDK